MTEQRINFLDGDAPAGANRRAPEPTDAGPGSAADFIPPTPGPALAAAVAAGTLAADPTAATLAYRDQWPAGTPADPDPNHTTVALDYPLARGEREIREITLRKPRAAELQGLSLTDLLSMDVATVGKLLPRISDLTRADVDRLDPADLVQLAAGAAGFFVSRKAKADAEAATR